MLSRSILHGGPRQTRSQYSRHGRSGKERWPGGLPQGTSPTLSHPHPSSSPLPYSRLEEPLQGPCWQKAPRVLTSGRAWDQNQSSCPQPRASPWTRPAVCLGTMACCFSRRGMEVATVLGGALGGKPRARVLPQPARAHICRLQLEHTLCTRLKCRHTPSRPRLRHHLGAICLASQRFHCTLIIPTM